MKVILCGYNWIGCNVLKQLIESGHDVFVYTHDSPPHVSDLKGYCKSLSVAYTTDKIQVENLPFKPEVICSIYYRYLISQEVINSCEKRIFNLHPSLLPRYRGCSSITWALINGESEIGYSFHYIVPKIDEGNIILQREVKVEQFDTQLSLYNRIMDRSSMDFQTALDRVVNGDSGIPQKGEGEYYKRGAPHNGIIDPSWSIDKVERFIRAMTHPPLPYATFEGHEIRSLDEYLNLV